LTTYLNVQKLGVTCDRGGVNRYFVVVVLVQRRPNGHTSVVLLFFYKDSGNCVDKVDYFGAINRAWCY
jgi:hypothetical protein